MATMDIGVISYNMSVFSAMGNKEAKFASEYSFLQRSVVVNLDDVKVTHFFVNSLSHLESTIKRLDAKVIGIQEFHEPTLAIIKKTLNNSNFAYHPFSKKITNDAAVLTIWDAKLLGNKVSAYDEDLGLTEGVDGLLPNDKGRPISIIKTEKGYTLINFHGINRPKYNATGNETKLDNSSILKALIAKHADLAGLASVDPNKIIVMCDSNDREHGINSSAPLLINGAKLHDGRAMDDREATSCCYNWDSCGIPVSRGKVTLGKVGAEKEYKYTGDYVLGTNVKTPVTAEDSAKDVDGASIESDHKLVYAVLSVAPEFTTEANMALAAEPNFQNGGRRQTRRQNQRQRQSQRQNQRQRQSQRQNQRQSQRQNQRQSQRQNQRQSQRQSRR